MDSLFKGNVINGGISTVDLVDPFSDGSGIALYKLNGDATDESGNYNGTPTDITYTSGIFGQRAVFNGSSSKITIPYNHTSGEISFSFHFTPNSIGTDQRIVSKKDDTTAVNAFHIALTTAGKIEYLNEYGTSTYYTQVSTSTLSAGVTYFIRISFTASGASLYIDETLEASDSDNHIASTTALMNNTPFLIGTNLFESGGWLDGGVDQFRILNRALTINEGATLENERKV